MSEPLVITRLSRADRRAAPYRQSSTGSVLRDAGKCEQEGANIPASWAEDSRGEGEVPRPSRLQAPLRMLLTAYREHNPLTVPRSPVLPFPRCCGRATKTENHRPCPVLNIENHSEPSRNHTKPQVERWPAPRSMPNWKTWAAFLFPALA